jgi:hypothetical protein
VLVYNTNTTRFARGTLHLAPRLCDEPVLKAIAHSTGERHLPKPDGTTIALLLKPTAAELFEIH